MRGLLLTAEEPRKVIYIPASFLCTSSVTMKQHFKAILNLERLWVPQAALEDPQRYWLLSSHIDYLLGKNLFLLPLSPITASRDRDESKSGSRAPSST